MWKIIVRKALTQQVVMRSYFSMNYCDLQGTLNYCLPSEIPEECIYDVEERVAEDCELGIPSSANLHLFRCQHLVFLIEPQTPVDSAEVLAGCDDMDGNCESSDCACLNPFEDLPLPTPLETAVSPRPRQLGHGDSNNLVNTDKKLIAKVAGIKAGFKHFRRRISSCFVAQGE